MYLAMAKMRKTSNIRSTLYSRFEKELPEENKKLLWKKLNHFITSCQNSECYQGSTSSNKIEDELQNNREFFRERSQSSKGPSTVYGFENEVLSLERMLLKSGSDDRFKAIAVVGMAGVGNEVYALHLELMTKKYLIVLEDCEETDGWYEKLYCCSSNGEKWGEQLYYGFPKGYGGAVIVTSRNEEVAKKIVGEENLLQLQPLSDPESCWSIYKDSDVEKGMLTPLASKQLKEKLKTKCGGLPLAAKLMGKIKADQQVGNAATQAQAQAQDTATMNS